MLQAEFEMINESHVGSFPNASKRVTREGVPTSRGWPPTSEKGLVVPDHNPDLYFLYILPPISTQSSNAATARNFFI